MEITIKNNWDEITWREYEQIEQILATDIPSDFKAIHLISVLTGLTPDEVERLPVSQFNKLLPAINFINKKAKTHYHKFKYTINGREYDFKGKLEEITTAQYLDYRTYMNEEEKDVVKLMSVFLIPVGHDYNDGYDMNQVMNDINDMCWLDIKAASFFFRIQLAMCMLISKRSLRKLMKESKATKSQIKEVEESLNNMAYSLLYSKSAKPATQILTR